MDYGLFVKGQGKIKCINADRKKQCQRKPGCSRRQIHLAGVSEERKFRLWHFALKRPIHLSPLDLNVRICPNLFNVTDCVMKQNDVRGRQRREWKEVGESTMS